MNEFCILFKHILFIFMKTTMALALGGSFFTSLLMETFIGYKAANERPGDATGDFFMVIPMVATPAGIVAAVGGIIYTLAN